jgi:hypothetical protein
MPFTYVSELLTSARTLRIVVRRQVTAEEAQRMSLVLPSISVNDDSGTDHAPGARASQIAHEGEATQQGTAEEGDYAFPEYHGLRRSTGMYYGSHAVAAGKLAKPKIHHRPRSNSRSVNTSERKMIVFNLRDDPVMKKEFGSMQGNPWPVLCAVAGRHGRIVTVNLPNESKIIMLSDGEEIGRVMREDFALIYKDQPRFAGLPILGESLFIAQEQAVWHAKRTQHPVPFDLSIVHRWVEKCTPLIAETVKGRIAKFRE